MANWLQKLLPPPAVSPKTGKAMVSRTDKPLAPLAAPPPPQSLPNATIIYGIGASLLFVSSFFLLLEGRWVPAITVFALGACLTGFALHLLKHQD
jgi:hypothetical protein